MANTSQTESPFTPPAPSPEHAATQRVATRLVELCSAGKNQQAIEELYADDARSVEAMEMPGCPRVTDGKKAILAGSERFVSTTTIHDATYGKPIVNGDQFICAMGLDCTSSEGPMAGQRVKMSETALYTVKNGKIVESRFFYSCEM